MTTSRRGDVLRAYKELEVSTDDHELRDAIAALLGMEWLPARQMRVPASMPSPPPSPPERDDPLVESGTTPQAPHIPSVERPTNASPEPFEMKLVRGPERRPPRWVEEAVPLPRVDAGTSVTPIRVAPLLQPLQARAVLSGVLARHTAEGPLDIPRIVDYVARGEATGVLPRMRVPTIARGVQLLIDRGDGMAPYAADVSWLRDALMKVVGGYALDVLHFAYSPLRGAGKGSRRTWKPYAQLLPPRVGTTVVAVTDLGIRSLPPPADTASTEEWVALADHLDRFGCPLVALVPYGRRRWPARLRRRFAIVEWDRHTTAAKVRATLARGLR